MNAHSVRSLSAEQAHAWVSRNLPDGPRPPILRPLNYVRIATVTSLILGALSLVTVAGPYLLFTSGHMFNHIRKVPYVSGDGKGGITYFANGFSNQFGMETQIIAAICKSVSMLRMPRH